MNITHSMLAKIDILRLVVLIRQQALFRPFAPYYINFFFAYSISYPSYFTLWNWQPSLVRRFVPKCTAVSAVSTAVTPYPLSSATRLVLIMYLAHLSVCRLLVLQLHRLRLRKKTNYKTTKNNCRLNKRQLFL